MRKEGQIARAARYELDPGKNPKVIAIVRDDAAEKETAIRGIYRIEGETFTLCFIEDPKDAVPADFTTGPDSKSVLLVMKRVPKGEAAKDEKEENFFTARDRMISQNNLKQIGLAFHMYHDTHRHFPPAAADAEGGLRRPRGRARSGKPKGSQTRLWAWAGIR